ncbi:HU family DNA-binding protein [Gemmatimonas sp.]
MIFDACRTLLKLGRHVDPLVESMTKADLVENVTARIARTAGPTISKKDCARVVDAFLDAIKEALQEQKNIEVRGFGTFKIRQRKTRMARNPRTGSPVEVSARPVPVFKPSKELRAMVAGVDESMLEDEEGDEMNEA